MSDGEAGMDEFKMKNGWVILERPADGPPITLAGIEALEEEEYDEEFRKAVSPPRSKECHR